MRPHKVGLPARQLGLRCRQIRLSTSQLSSIALLIRHNLLQLLTGGGFRSDQCFLAAPFQKGPLHIRLGCLDSTASVRNGRIRGNDSCVGRRDIGFRRANSVGGLCDSRVL